MWSFRVPNAPCGVERQTSAAILCAMSMFLMHRVELKVPNFPSLDMSLYVPNAPCGVERGFSLLDLLVLQLFLMHRVELKDG